MSRTIAPDGVSTPYWIDAIGATQSSVGQERPLPTRADVVVIGGGLTGVSAGWVLANAGRATVILDAGVPGEGASSRNAGFLGRHTKHSYLEMKKTKGASHAGRFFRTMQEVYQAARQRITDEGLDCDHRASGRVIAALSARHRDQLHREFEARAEELGEDLELLSGSIGSEIGTGRYSGGVLIRDNGSLQPAKYYRAMQARALRQGAELFAGTAALGITEEAGGFSVLTTLGTIRARNVLVATNGYSRAAAAGFRKHLVPINAYMLATEPLPESMLRSLLPANRTYIEWRRSPNYMRLSPDGTRLIFGGQTARMPGRQVGLALQSEMTALFPDLKGVRIANFWHGLCAAPRDLLPRAGIRNGIHFAMGYCFSGNAMAPFLGELIARRMLSHSFPSTIFEESEMPYFPTFARSGYFVSCLMHINTWMDRLSV